MKISKDNIIAADDCGKITECVKEQIIDLIYKNIDNIDTIIKEMYSFCETIYNKNPNDYNENFYNTIVIVKFDKFDGDIKINIIASMNSVRKYTSEYENIYDIVHSLPSKTYRIKHNFKYLDVPYYVKSIGDCYGIWIDESEKQRMIKEFVAMVRSL